MFRTFMAVITELRYWSSIGNANNSPALDILKIRYAILPLSGTPGAGGTHGDDLRKWETSAWAEMTLSE